MYVSLEKRLKKLQIRELMYEKNRNQSVKKKDNYLKWGIIFISSYIGMIICVLGIVVLSKIILFMLCLLWQFHCYYLFLHFINGFMAISMRARRAKSVNIYQKIDYILWQV